MDSQEKKMIVKAIRSHINVLQETIADLSMPPFCDKPYLKSVSKNTVDIYHQEIESFENLLIKFKKIYGLE